MKALNQLLQKNFSIKSEDALLKLILKKPEAFFELNFFMDKESYIQNIKKLLDNIKQNGDSLSDLKEMASPGSILGSYGGREYGAGMSAYLLRRKVLINRIAFFKKKIN